MDKTINGLDNGKCVECESCGHSGCCSPINCNMTNSSIYCKKYLVQLKATYTAYSKIYELVYASKEKYPDLFLEVDKINDDRNDEMER